MRWPWPLCALYHMPHGQACSMVLPAVLQYNSEVCNEKIIRLLSAMNLYDKTRGSDAADMHNL